LVSQAYQHTKRSGWCDFKIYLQTSSNDNSLSENTNILKYHLLLVHAVKRIGKTHAPEPKLKGFVTAAGYENVKEEAIGVPLGTWPKEKSLRTSITLIFMLRSLGILNFNVRFTEGDRALFGSDFS
jgi:hypothetical protein